MGNFNILDTYLKKFKKEPKIDFVKKCHVLGTSMNYTLYIESYVFLIFGYKQIIYFCIIYFITSLYYEKCMFIIWMWYE